jgi:hypothetical protein
MFPKEDGIYTGFPEGVDILKSVLQKHEDFKKQTTKDSDIMKVTDPKYGILYHLNERHKQDGNYERLQQLFSMEGEFHNVGLDGVLRQLLINGIVMNVIAFEKYAYEAVSESLDIVFRFRSKNKIEIKRFQHFIQERVNSRLWTEDVGLWEQMLNLQRPVKGNRPMWKDVKPQVQKLLQYFGKLAKKYPNDKQVVAVIQGIAMCNKRHILKKWLSPMMYDIQTTFKQMLVDSKPTLKEKDVIAGVEQLTGHWAQMETFNWISSDNCAYKVKVGNYKTMCYLSNLFYGIRCIFAHGSLHETLEHGALSEDRLPKSKNDIQIIDIKSGQTAQECVEQVWKMCADVKITGKQMPLDYYLFTTIGSFYKYFVRVVEKVCACFIFYITYDIMERGRSIELAGLKPEDGIEDALNAVKRYLP